MPSEHFALLSQTHGARTAQDQLCSDASLEPSDHSAQTRLAQVEPLRSPTVVLLFAEHEKTANGTKIQIDMRSERRISARDRPD
jgi:hypothetical protein